jgi:diacylglycerol O-acyltransferase-1
VVASLAFRMLVAVTAYTFLAAQVVTPTLEHLVRDLEATRGTFTPHILAAYWLKLSVANTYLWLLMFYIYFHLYLNLFAEILRFGDRVFYRDWWNSSEVSAYWRLWNTPVHYWLIRHVYFPCLRRKVSRPAATFIVFLLSAVMHEVLVSVPFHMIRPWSFLGMLGQIPLVGLTKQLERKYPGSSLGNVIFWISFCVVGQPMAILLYTIDYQFQKHHHGSISGAEPFGDPGDECRIMWRDRCLIR